MTTQTTTTLKNAGTNALALLAAYLLQKVSDKNTKFADTQTALKTVALSAVNEIVTTALTNASATTTAPTNDTTQPIAQ